ncbi:uncharacterized protein BO97DRAFT_170941 [Aspergillus homomorphus CBS 101889]|uniref:Uncharacterized protein n=1 Tax=Aspergillus homomorphus (strain CBS 101889) TaxID=1450537 RepID=A0A395HND6_ASPHC|nr:hypothetical protein BO97DRAFT_170941 [Aspergillus homomorphus CBS 101889]RAL09270.1 hypothetical protein BO97DRAFT_170941 [Aspergillus homomorphus CBS 101889]
MERFPLISWMVAGLEADRAPSSRSSYEAGVSECVCLSVVLSPCFPLGILGIIVIFPSFPSFPTDGVSVMRRLRNHRIIYIMTKIRPICLQSVGGLGTAPGSPSNTSGSLPPRTAHVSYALPLRYGSTLIKSPTHISYDPPSHYRRAIIPIFLQSSAPC